MSNPPRNRRWLAALGLSLFALLLLAAQLRAPHEQNWIDRVVLWLTAPLQKAVGWSLEGGASLWRSYVWLVDVEEENARLRTELAALRNTLTDQRTLLAENERLRELTRMRSQLGALPVTGARVIGLGTSPVSRVVRIDAGASEGVQVGDAVVAGGGLVGRVSGVSGGWAEVLLLVDSRAAVDVVVERSRARGIVRGRGDLRGVDVDHLVRTADVQVGDELVTSGLGGTYPSGLRVGTVLSVTTPMVGVFRDAELTPAVDFALLEELLVVRAPVPAPRPGEGGGAGEGRAP
ncbi:MAG TPA: rod shape-determining protein MreC [Myxococcota bacterium]|nr:rod shape-determining protein MreC [Myxococcota bacterium]HRY95933.1 rod shape-determining protein MreC [Myxococcota bacterium]